MHSADLRVSRVSRPFLYISAETQFESRCIEIVSAFSYWFAVTEFVRQAYDGDLALFNNSDVQNVLQLLAQKNINQN